MSGANDQDDPVRWSAGGGPLGASELLEVIEPPVAMPPALRTRIRGRLSRAVAPPARRWVTPAMLATAVVVGGVVLGLLRSSEPAPALDVEPVIEVARGEAARREGVVPATGGGPRSTDPSAGAPGPSLEGGELRPPETELPAALAGTDEEGAVPDEGSPDERRARERLAERLAVDSAGTGFLSVNSVPWSRVRVDDRDVGSTPVLRLVLAAGVHRVRLEAADGTVHEASVTVEPGETTWLRRDLRGAVAEAPAPAREDSAADPTNGTSVSLYDAARAAAIVGNHREVVRLLNGRARTQRELELLIVSLRAVPGMDDDVERAMREYMERFPASPRASAYAQYLATRPD